MARYITPFHCSMMHSIRANGVSGTMSDRPVAEKLVPDRNSRSTQLRTGWLPSAASAVNAPGCSNCVPMNSQA